MWVIMLFGNEFDADKRAEVGWGLRGGEGERSDLTAVGFLDGLGRVERQITDGHPVVDGHAHDGDFVGDYHELITM